MDEKSYSQRQYRRMREKKTFGMHLSRKDHAELEEFSRKSGFVYRNYVQRRRRHTSLSEHLSAPARLGRKPELRFTKSLSERVPARWLTAESFDPQAGYISVFKKSIIADEQLFQSGSDVAMFSALLAGFTGVAGTGAGLVLGLGGAGIGALLGMPGEVGQLVVFSSMGGGAGLGMLGGFGRMLVSGICTLRWRGGIHAREAFSLNAWLVARYGLEVSETCLASLIERVYINEGEQIFGDAAGASHVLKLDADSQRWFVYPPDADAAQEPSASAVDAADSVPEVQAADVLSGEAVSLYTHVVQQLAALAGATLSVEQAHVVSRVRQDLGATVTLCRRLQPLGGLDEAQQRQVSGVLAELSSEVRAVADELRAEVSRELNVQQAYLIARRQRREPRANSLLTLPRQIAGPVKAEVEAGNDW